MSEQPNTQELAKIALLSGRMNTFHLKNLKAFPFILFNDLKEVKLEYSVENVNSTEPTIFSYDLTLNLESNNHLNKRYSALESAIRELFWDGVKVQIKINGKEVYKSE